MERKWHCVARNSHNQRHKVKLQAWHRSWCKCASHALVSAVTWSISVAAHRDCANSSPACRWCCASRMQDDQTQTHAWLQHAWNSSRWKGLKHSQSSPQSQEYLQPLKRIYCRDMQRSSQVWVSFPEPTICTLTQWSRRWSMHAEMCPSVSWTHLKRHWKNYRKGKW